MQAEMLVLRLIHIIGGSFWVGTSLFMMFFLMPTLAQAGPAAGTIMAGLQRRRMMTIMPIVAVLTILSGLRLLWIVSGGDPHYFEHRTGHTYAVSGAFAIISFILGIFVGRPAAMRAAYLAQMTTSVEMERAKLAAEVQALQKRATVATMIAVVLVILAAIGMAIARYL
jgi:uncharacterized membrane protein